MFVLLCLASSLYFLGENAQVYQSAAQGQTVPVFPLIPGKIASGAELQCFSVASGLHVYLKPFT